MLDSVGLRSRTLRAATLGAGLLGAALAAAGCGGDDGGGDDAPEYGDPTTGAWRTDFGLPGPSGFGARVEDLAVGRDGALYAAGIFDDAAGVPVRNVARWTGTAWQPLGDGLDGWVRAIAIEGDETVWAAVTTDDGEGRLARWNGTGWATVGELDGGPVDVAVLDGAVAVVGHFTEVGGVAAAGVAVYDGAGWSAVGDGTVDGEVTAIAGDRDTLCVAGQFATIGGVEVENAACWDGEAWAPLGAGLPGGVATLVRAPDGRWFAGGTLTFIIDWETGAYEAGIAVLEDGTWHAFEGGIDGGYINEVRAIAFDRDEVIVGGHFKVAGPSYEPAHMLARWSPEAGWSEVGGGLDNDIGVFLIHLEGAHAVAIADGEIYVGGLFTRAGGGPAVNVARIDGEDQVAALVGDRRVLGLGGFVDTVAALPDGRVLAGGLFGFAGMTPVANLAAFDGDTTWTELGGGLPGIVREVLVRRDGTVAVAGELGVDGQYTAFAVWNGTAWTMPGGPVDGAGFALAEDADGVLWLAGDLSEAGGAQLSNLARLDGTQWSSGGVFDERVTSLVIHDGQLVAGGQFSTADGTAARGLAVRGGAGWAELGGGLDGDYAYVSALGSSAALGLVVGGTFEGVGGQAIPDLARWDGAAWRGLAGGVSSEHGFAFVSTVLPYGPGVFVAGGFDRGGSAPASNLAWFDGAAWHALGGGLADLAEAMVVVDDVLYVGGPFTAAGGYPSSGLAVWDFREARTQR